MYSFTSFCCDTLRVNEIIVGCFFVFFTKLRTEYVSTMNEFRCIIIANITKINPLKNS